MTEYYDTWDPNAFETDANYQLAIREFTRGLIKGDVLDAGCGSRIVYSLENASSWHGVDVSVIMTDQALFTEKPSQLEVSFHKGDIRSLPFAEDSFDTVIVQFVLHHLGERSRKESFQQVSYALTELRRVIRPQGKIIIIENASGPLERPYHLLFPLFWRLGLALGVRLPFFLKNGELKELAIGCDLKFITSMQIPIDEKIYNPVLRFRVSPFFSSDLFQKMTIYLFTRPND